MKNSIEQLNYTFQITQNNQNMLYSDYWQGSMMSGNLMGNTGNVAYSGPKMKSGLEKAGDVLSYTSLGINAVGIGFAASSVFLGPQMLVPAEVVSIGAAVVDISALVVYLADVTINRNLRSGVKSLFSFASVILDITVSASYAVKPALYGSRFYSTTTGRYVAGSLRVAVGTARPFIVGGIFNTIPIFISIPIK